MHIAVADTMVLVLLLMQSATVTSQHFHLKLLVHTAGGWGSWAGQGDVSFPPVGAVTDECV